MSGDFRQLRNEYFRSMVLAAMSMLAIPGTAEDIAERVVGLMAAEMHPEHLQRSVSASSVAGYLRGLQADGQVIKGNTARNARHGRDEPVWILSVAAPKPHPVPFPPAGAPTCGGRRNQSVKKPGLQNYEEFTRPQMIAALQISDEIADAVGAFVSNMKAINARAREKLASLGVDIP